MRDLAFGKRRLLGCALAAAAAGPQGWPFPTAAFSDAIRTIGDDGRPVAASPPPPAAAARPLSQAEVERRLGSIPAVAIVNADDSPFFTTTEGGQRVGYFFLDPTDALRELRGDPKALGGALRLRPSQRQIVFANRALQYNTPDGAFIPIAISAEKGQVPVFYSERVSLTSADGSKNKFPFYFRKEDLDADFLAMAAGGQLPGGGAAGGAGAAGGGGGEAANPRSNSARRAAKAAGDASAAAGGIPIGLTRVATLDGLVRQMRSGEVDLQDAVLVGSRDALKLSQQLVTEQIQPR